ncbi:oligosaccharide flippase family protein [Candidatus Curtissbacteria bacterium]|nr:oligosaccharide flippase family protein [Candidatus Curtissbacteria bacterium]
MNQREVLKKKVASGALVLGVKRILIQGIFWLSNIFLARLLFPSDFGVWGIIVYVGTILLVFSDLGMVPALIQKKEKLQEDDVQTAFTFQLILALILVTVMFLISGPIANFYNLGESGQFLMVIYSLLFVVGPFRQIPAAILERNLDYKRLVAVELATLVVSSLSTVSLAFLKFGVASFVLGLIIGQITAAGLYFLISPWPVGLFFSKRHFLNLGKFGAPFQLNMIMGLFYGPLILLYLGKIVGSVNLGFYQFAASIAVFPLATAEIVNRIVFPLGSRIQQDKIFFRKIIERSVTIVSILSLPVILAMLSAAREIVHFIYTDRWLAALPAIYIGLLQIGIMAYSGVFAQLLLARGQAGVIRNMGIVFAILTWILGPPLIGLFNFVGMSMAGFLISASGIWLIFRLRREVEFAFWENFYPYLISALASGLLILVVNNLLPKQILSLIFALICGAVFYWGLLIVWRGRVLLENFKALVLALVKS